MNETEFQELVDKVGKEAAEKIKTEMESYTKTVNETIENTVKGLITSEQLEVKLKEMSEKVTSDMAETEGFKKLNDSIEEMQKSIKEQSEAIAGAKETAIAGEGVSLKDQISNVLKDKTSELKEFKNSQSKNVGFAFTVNKATVSRSSITSDTQAMRIPGVARAQRRRPYLREQFTAGQVSPDNHGVIRYVDQTTDTNSATSIAEGGAYPTTSTIAWTERSIAIQKVGDFIKLSREMMNDVSYVEGEVNNFLLRNVDLKIDTDLLTGTGVSPVLKGVKTSATAFAAGSYASTVESAQLYDLIVVIASQIMTGTNFIPNTVLLNPLDASTKLKLKKDAEENYLIPTFVVVTPEGEMIVDGMKVIVNSGVAVGDMYVGDFTRGTVYSSEDLQIEFGYEDDDFSKDLVSVKASERLALLIRTIDAPAFVFVDDIDTAITAISV